MSQNEEPHGFDLEQRLPARGEVFPDLADSDEATQWAYAGRLSSRADAMPSCAGVRKDAHASASAENARRGWRGTLTASEAARLRWSRQREKQSEEDDGDAQEHDASDVDEQGVIERLKRRVEETGDPQAARELRAWLDRAKEAAPDVVDVAAMSREQRDWMIARMDANYRAMMAGEDVCPACGHIR
jgi:hypothetical protein